MRTAEELIHDAKEALENEDYDEVVEIVSEALGHISDFSWRTGVTWEWSDVKECLNEIGEIIYEQGGLDAMRDVHEAVYFHMKPVAARYLEKSWDGCGDGAWRG